MSFFHHAGSVAATSGTVASAPGATVTAEFGADVSVSYQRRLERAAARSHAGVLARQEIGKLPPTKDPERRARCAESLEEHLRTYHARAFNKPFAGYHRELIAEFEKVIRGNGRRVVAIERGGGKSVLCLGTAEWAILNGLRRFAVFIGDTATTGGQLQEKLINLMRSSDELVEDYPELRVFRLATDNRKKLRSDGVPIQFAIKNKDGQTVFPDFPWSQCCQAIVASTGMTGNGMRGASFVDRTGEVIRPDLILLDDPQNDESARSPEQTLHREEMIENSFMGLAGGDVKLAALMPITVQNNDCLASRYLDRQRHGDWHGMRYQAVPQMPERMDLWDRFGELLRTGDTPEDGVEAARQFYRDNFDEMNRGAVVSWPENHPPDDLSALEKYMRLYYLKPDYFSSEIQQQGRISRKTEKMTRELLNDRLNGLPRGVVPDNAAHLVAFVDSHADLLYWMVMAIATDASGWIVDYGTWPEQNTRLFTLRGATQTISRLYSDLPEDEGLIAAHLSLDRFLLGRQWKRESGHEISIERAIKDTGWKTDVIMKAILMSPHREIIRPARGWTVRAGRTRIHEWKLQTRGVDNHTGPDWIERFMKDNGLKRVHIDTNRWKSALALGLVTTPGAVGSITMYGSDPREHQLLIEHFLAESRQPDRAAGEEIDIWTNPPSHPDNHWWDCAAGCMVAGSMLGALGVGQQRHAVVIERREVEVPSWMLSGGR